ncbi:hypothetical protein MSBR3_0492 [Methanosarcina barkeri 3]|uniref:Uncharacterized protein n=1 Tax=Methanosarcina barkeri 3 TaxID=1434107 RepID=A0A0E3WVG9_METBA|nr:hypothetical protein [Methanosarcina barkeri]AKB81070.1 hypothetical protein MSBR3_0492 [Methanosarcina barkeri 3]
MGGFPFFKKFDNCGCGCGCGGGFGGFCGFGGFFGGDGCGCGCKKEKEVCCITAVRACKIKGDECDGWGGWW